MEYGFNSTTTLFYILTIQFIYRIMVFDLDGTYKNEWGYVLGLDDGLLSYRLMFAYSSKI